MGALEDLLSCYKWLGRERWTNEGRRRDELWWPRRVRLLELCRGWSGSRQQRMTLY